MNFCKHCGQKFESEIPRFCSGCGKEVILEKVNHEQDTTVPVTPEQPTIQTKETNQERNDQKPNSSEQNPKKEEPKQAEHQQVHNNFVDKAVIITPENMNQIKKNTPDYGDRRYEMSPRPIANSQSKQNYIIMAIVAVLLIGGFVGYRVYDNHQKQLQEMAFHKELDDFKYEVETQWELLVMNSSDFKEKCDKVYNKPNKDMSLADKLRIYQTEAIGYRKSLQSIKSTLDKIKMSSQLQNHNNLSVFMNDLIIAINTNIDYCDNIINITGDPKNAKKEAQNKGQDVENSYMMIYRCEDFKNYFTAKMRITDLDSIGGMIEVTATDRVKTMNTTKKPNHTAVVININGKTVGSGGGYSSPTTSSNFSTNPEYYNQMKNILKRVVAVRVEFSKIPQQYRSGQINKATFQSFCQTAGNQRDSLAAEVQNISNIPAEEANRHQMVIQSLLAGSAACYNIASELNKFNDGDWETVLKYISDYNSKNLDPILDYYQL